MADVRTVDMRVNGEQRRATVDVRTTLADTLRDDYGCTGVHLGCEQGACGACTVLLDGRSVRSCLILTAQAAGADIRTIEGVADPDGRLSPLQEAFHAAHGLQCGFCTPGMIMTAVELLRETPDPTPDQIRAADRETCAVVPAIRTSSRRSPVPPTSGPASPGMTGYIGKDVARLEDHRFLTGRGMFIADVRLQGMVDVAFVRSAQAHGTIAGIDTGAARAHPGVVAVLTAADVDRLTAPFTRQFYSVIDPALVAECGLRVGPYRAPVLAADRVLRVGEAVAMVLAESRYIAEDAAELVDLTIDPLPPLVDPLKRREPEPAYLHADVPGNVHSEFTVVVGRPQAALATADRRLSRRFRIRRSIGCPIETRGVIARYEAGSGFLTVWSTTQTPHILRSYLSEMLRMRQDSIRVVKPDMGGSFGGGIYPEEIAVACAAISTGRPVRWIEDREENLFNARHSRDQWHDVRVGYNRDGRILALLDDVVVDSGAYNPFNVTLSYNAASHIRNQFDIENFWFHGRHVLTNKQPATPVRGAGRTEATFVMDRSST